MQRRPATGRRQCGATPARLPLTGCAQAPALAADTSRRLPYLHASHRLLSASQRNSAAFLPPDPPPRAPASPTAPLHPLALTSGPPQALAPPTPTNPAQGDAYLAAYRDHKPGALAAHEAAGRMVHDVIDLAWLRRCEASGQLEPVKRVAARRSLRSATALARAV
jgi:hypothetical protein